MRQGGEAVLLLLQRVRWDVSGRLVARDLIRKTVDLGIVIGWNNLVTNMSFPSGYVGKGRDLFLLIKVTISRHCECLNVVSQICPLRPVAASWTCSLDGVKEQHGPHAALNACGNGNKAPTTLRVRTQTIAPEPIAVMTDILCDVELLSRPSESARTPTYSRHLSGFLSPLTPGRIAPSER